MEHAASGLPVTTFDRLCGTGDIEEPLSLILKSTAIERIELRRSCVELGCSSFHRAGGMHLPEA